MTTYEYGSCCGQLVRVNNPDGTWLGYEYDNNKNVTARLTPWGRTRTGASGNG
jgi:YD repeat-containing protein